MAEQAVNRSESDRPVRTMYESRSVLDEVQGIHIDQIIIYRPTVTRMLTFV